MTRTAARSIRRSLALGALALVAVPVAAQAAPLDPPTVGNLPGFAQNTSLGVHWTIAAGTFAPGTINRSFEVRAVDLTGGPVVTKNVGATDTAASLALTNGHQYSVQVRAHATTVINQPNPFPDILIPQAGAWSAARVTRMDNTDPNGSVVVNNGAAYTNSRDVLLSLNASDPLSAGQPSSGVGAYQVGEGTIPCPLLVLPGSDTSGCPKPMVGTAPFTLKPGPDGVRTVSVIYRDQAQRTSTSPFPLFLGPDGNASTQVQDQILLDTTAPTAKVTPAAATIPNGTPLQVDGSTSVDGTSGPADSGVDPATYSWAFGDGTTATGPTAAHTYAQPGTYTGQLTVKDKAGNQGSTTFSVTVSPPPAPAPATPAGQPGGGTQAGGGSTPSGLAPLTLGRINKAGRFKVGKSCAVTLKVSRSVRVKADMRNLRGRIVRRAARTGGPGTVKLAMSCPVAGRYVVTAQAGGKLRTLAVRVRR